MKTLKFNYGCEIKYSGQVMDVVVTNPNGGLVTHYPVTISKVKLAFIIRSASNIAVPNAILF